MHLTHTTPFLISTNYNSFDDYLNKLSKSSYKNYKYCIKNNNDLNYSKIDVNNILIDKFAKLWGKQIINGNISGITSLELNYNRLQAYVAIKNNEIICLHLVELHDKYLDCQMPMFDKKLYDNRYLAKYMWFKLIESCIKNPNINFIDMWGGAYGKNWKEVISNYKLFKKQYKYIFVTDDLKKDSSKEIPYVVSYCKRCQIKILHDSSSKDFNICNICK